MSVNPAESGSAPSSGSGSRKLATAVLGVLFVLSFLAFLAAVVVRTQLLDAELYVQALAEVDAYERIYTQVLADPAVQERFKDKVGSELDLVVEELFAQIVAAGVIVLPPSRLQAATERVIRGVVGYVRGEQPAAEAGLRLGEVVDREALKRRLGAAIVAASAERLARAGPEAQNAASPPEEGPLRSYLADLASGKVRPMPEEVGRLTEGGLPAPLRQRLTAALQERAENRDPRERRQLEASLASGDLSGALSEASLAVLRPRIEQAVTGLLDRNAPGDTVDGLALAAGALGETRDGLVQQLDQVRAAADLARVALVPLILLMLALVVGIVWLNGHDLRSAMAGVGWTLTAAAGSALVLWILGSQALSSLASQRLQASLGEAAGLADWVGDVVAAVSGAVFTSVMWLILFWLVVGVLALAFAYSAGLGAWLRGLLEPLGPNGRWVLAGVVGLIVAVPLVARMVQARQLAANPPCNGHVELCDRPVNEVVFASSHNAMSITQYGWLWPMHDGTVTDQLEAGVRALLVDTLYLEDPEAEAEYLDTLAPAEREVAEEAIADFDAGDLASVLLCHGSCKLGASDFGSALEEIRTFLEANPREVLVLMIQDEISAADTDAVVEEHGLGPYLYTHPSGAPWPTLRELIDSNQRLLVMAENQGPPPDWYLNAWTVTEETPYTFVFKEDFSCTPNRGETGKPFFLLNHWIQRIAPNRVDAAIVNDYDFLLARAQQCAAERGKVPNFVAVNFYGQGDLFRVVDTLNGVGEAPAETPADTNGAPTP